MNTNATRDAEITAARQHEARIKTVALRLLASGKWTSYQEAWKVAAKTVEHLK